MIGRFGYEVPFYFTAGLYLTASLGFYLRFRGTVGRGRQPVVAEAVAGAALIAPLRRPGAR